MKRSAASIIRTLAFSLFIFAVFYTEAKAAFITVTSTADSGANTLRQAITDASPGDSIVFSLTYPATITLASALTVNKNLSIRGPGAAYLIVSGNNVGRVFDITSGTVSISRLTLANGRVSGSGENGAGVRLSGTAVVTMDECCLVNNTLIGGSNHGAGFYVPSGASLTLLRSSVYMNSVPMTAGCEGGAVYTAGNLTLAYCVLYNNTAYFGSALCNWGTSGKTATLSNCTISGNNSYADSAIVHNSTGSLSLINCTVTSNVSAQYEAGLFADAGSVNLRNTVIAGNLPSNGMGDTDIFLDTAGLYGGDSVSFSSSGYNLIGSTGSQTYTWTTGDIVGTEAAKQNANLAALSTNGGYVSTHLPNLGSQVIDPASGNSAPFVDSRGYLRSGTADKGACEYNGSLPTATAATGVGLSGYTANWNAATGAAGYLLEVATNAECTDLVPGYANQDVGNVVSYPVTGLSPGTTYFYRIRAYNGMHESYYSNTISATTLTPPTATFTSTATVTPSTTCTITPTFTATSSFTATRTVTSTPTVTPSFTATVTQADTRTATPSGTATVTATATATLTATQADTRTATPSGTATVTATATATRTATATVTATGTASSTASPTLNATQTDTPTPTMTPIAPDTPTFTPTPIGYPPALSATPTATVTLTVTATGGGLEQVALNHKRVLAYPNPAKDRMSFLLHLSQPSAVQISILNFGGEKVALLRQSLPAGAGQTIVWNCGDVASGLYLVVITLDNEVYEVLKVAIMR
ncbi:MAG: choice-of-anchor Q domain-containing protein [candidate division FCPU426 bacterium]